MEINTWKNLKENDMFECFKKKAPKIKDIPTPKRESYPMDFLKIALSITGSFEGSGYGNVAGNFDGQGLSAGILQWNYGQGSLQNKILNPIIQATGSDYVDSFFPSPVSHSAIMGPKEAIKFAKSKMLNGKRLKPEWQKAWKNFMITEVVKKQQHMAADSIASKAWSYCKDYNMKSLRAFCWFFDIVTQNGSLRGVEMPSTKTYFEDLEKDAGKNLDHWKRYSTVHDEESRILFTWTCRRVKRNQWADDVISRKGTIAHSLGMVHGKFYNFVDIFNES